MWGMEMPFASKRISLWSWHASFIMLVITWVGTRQVVPFDEGVWHTFHLQHFSQGKKFNYPKKSFENSWAFCQSINKKTINPKSHVSHEISDSFKFCLLYLDCFQNIYTSLQKKKKKGFNPCNLQSILILFCLK